MSILIKGMEMPQRCMGCTLCYVGHMGDLMCEALRRPIKVDETGRDRFCPLIEVPPHGRLIDADKLKAQYVHGKGNDEIESAWISNIRRAITKAPTVIEAED